MGNVSYVLRPGKRRWLLFGDSLWGPGERVFYLPKAATSLRDSGTERVLGVDTTRIDGVWDAKRLHAELRGPHIRIEDPPPRMVRVATTTEP